MHLHHAYGNNAYPVIPAGQVLPADESARFDMPSWQPLQEPPHCGWPPLHPCPRKKNVILAQHCRNCHYILLHAFKFRNNQVSGIFFVSRVNLFLRQTSHTGDFSVEIIRMSRTITGNWVYVNTLDTKS